MDAKQFLDLMVFLGIMESPQGRGPWRGRALAAKYAGFPDETGRLPRAKVGAVFRDGCRETTPRDREARMRWCEFCAVMRELSRMLVLDEAGPARRSGGGWGGPVTQGGTRPMGIGRLILTRAIAEAEAEGRIPARWRAETDRGANRKGLAMRTGSTTDRSTARESGGREGAQTERAGKAPKYTMMDLGGGYCRVSVNGGESKVVRDDAQKLSFAREAALHLHYK